MYIIAGLGNPGAQYAGTRHNVGFACIDELADQYNMIVGQFSRTDQKAFQHSCTSAKAMHTLSPVQL